MSPATVLQMPPNINREATRYEYTKYCILKHISENQPLPISDLYSFIDSNERIFAFPPGILSFEYIDVLLERNVIIKSDDNFVMTPKGELSFKNAKQSVEL